MKRLYIDYMGWRIHGKRGDYFASCLHEKHQKAKYLHDTTLERIKWKIGNHVHYWGW